MSLISFSFVNSGDNFFKWRMENWLTSIKTVIPKSFWIIASFEIFSCIFGEFCYHFYCKTLFVCDSQVTEKCVCVIPVVKFGKNMPLENIFLFQVNEIMKKTDMAAACVPC